MHVPGPVNRGTWRVSCQVFAHVQAASGEVDTCAANLWRVQVGMREAGRGFEYQFAQELLPILLKIRLTGK